ncbi:MAG: sulfatase [Phycisphaeraceae bacterium]|nr:sulfatase [Phycisphaeraceae bacterium]
MRSPTDRPNILLINCDDLGYGDLGCYGNDINATPAVDQLAEDGMRFTDFYMASPVCSPSRGAMMTGCYPARIGFDTFEGHWVLFPGQGVGLNPDETTVAGLLKEQGYATQIVGKWHCGDQHEFLPTRHGFDGYYGVPYSNDMGRQGKKPDSYPPLPLMDDEEVMQAQPDQSSLTERYVERSLRFMRKHQDEPFFLYLAHMHVHLPHYPPERFLEQAKNGRYGAAVECIDWSVAVLLDELDRLGLADNTLVIFTSDNGSRGRNGGGSNDPLNGHKGTTWEGGMRVPMIARWPGQIPAGTECDQLASAMDFLPTFTGLAGGEIPDDRTLDGRDIRPLLMGEDGAASPHEVFFYYIKDELQAVRNERWKLRAPTDDDAEELPVDPHQWHLYDLANDIGETTDVAADQPEIVEELAGHIEACRVALGDSISGTEGNERRPIGQVDNPRPLTEYDPDHPYIIAVYDLPQRG